MDSRISAGKVVKNRPDVKIFEGDLRHYLFRRKQEKRKAMARKVCPGEIPVRF